MTRGRLAALVIVSLAVSCGGTSNRQAGRAPGVPLRDGQSKCSVAASKSHPLVVEWPEADRAALESQMRRGVVPVEYRGCDMFVLSSCMVDGTYGYSAVTPKTDEEVIRNESELMANMPVGFAKFQSELSRSGQLTVSMVIVGQYETARHDFRSEELKGSCGRATHVITALTAGAFKFFSGAESAAGVGAQVMGAGASARTASGDRLLTTDGDISKCQSNRGDKRPPEGCGALIRIELHPLIGLNASAPGTEPLPASTSCPSGESYEAGRGCVAASSSTWPWWVAGGAAVVAAGAAAVIILNKDKQQDSTREPVPPGGLGSSPVGIPF